MESWQDWLRCLGLAVAAVGGAGSLRESSVVVLGLQAGCSQIRHNGILIILI